MRKSIVLSTVVLLAILGISIATAYDPTYYKPIYINNTGGSEQTYYQVLLNVSYDVGMDTEFDDLRVKYYNGDEWVFIPYWIEDKVNNEWCKLWFNATYIPANSWCNNSYRLYYADNLANSESSASDTFTREIDGLNASWHFDEGEGNTAYDTSGNDNDGTIYGASWTDGKFGEALSYDGSSNDYVNCGNDESLNITDEITIEAWVYKKSNTFYPGIVSKSRPGTTEQSYSLRFRNDGRAHFFVCANDGTVGSATSSVLENNRWYFLVGTYDKSHVKLYVDGDEVDSMEWSKDIKNVTLGVLIGRSHTSGRYFNGTIDEVRIYDRGLSAEEISDLYNYYGYTIEKYPGKVLVRKRIDPEPTASLGGTQIIDPADAVITLSPSNVKSNSLTMRGYLNYAPADVWIEWGTEHGGHVFKTSSKHMDDLGWITFDVTSPILFANKKYKYRAVAVVEGTTYYGEDYVFTMGDADIPDIVQNNTFSDSYNMINYTNLTTEAFALAIINVWTSVWGSFFWVLICGFPFVLMYITQHNTTIPGVLAMILGGTMLIYLPPEWQSVAYSLLIVAVAGIMVGIFKSKR